MSERFPITPEGYKKLCNNLEILKTKERPAVTQAIAEARAHGDLSENAEYHAAREKQGFVEAKILDLENKVSKAEIIEISELSGDQIKFGATVLLLDEDSDEKVQYKIVGDYESDIEKGYISISSPLAKALLGKKVGDNIEVFTPKGQKYYEVLQLQFK